MSLDVCAFATLALVVLLGVGGLVAAWLSVERDAREDCERVRRADTRIEAARRRVVASCEDISRARRQTLDRALAEAREASDSAKVSLDVPKIDTSRTKRR